MLKYRKHDGSYTKAHADTKCRCGKILREHSVILRLCDTSKNLDLRTFRPASQS